MRFTLFTDMNGLHNERNTTFHVHSFRRNPECLTGGNSDVRWLHAGEAAGISAIGMGTA